MVDMGAVPQRLEQGIGEPQRQQVLDRFLAEIMVDAEGPLLGKGSGDGVVDLAAGGEIAAQRLFQRQADGGAGQADRGEAVDGRLEQGRAVDRKIASPGEQSPTARPGNLEIFQTVSIDSDVAQAVEEALRDILLVNAFGEMLCQRLPRPLAKLTFAELGAGRADGQAQRQQPVGIQAVERRQQHSPGEVAGRPEEEQGGDYPWVKPRMPARPRARDPAVKCVGPAGRANRGKMPTKSGLFRAVFREPFRLGVVPTLTSCADARGAGPGA